MGHNGGVGRQVPGNRQNIGHNCPKLLIAWKNIITFRTTIFSSSDNDIQQSESGTIAPFTTAKPSLRPPVNDRPRGGTEMAAGSSGQPKAPVIVPGLFLFRRSLVAFLDDGLLLENPTCPNCGRVMKLKERPGTPKDQHIFKCEVCNLVFMTEDHLPVSG